MPPQPPDAIAAPRLGRETLRTDPPGAVASCSSSSRDRPTRSLPSFRATVAGTAPAVRIACSDAVATSTLSGYASPWLMSVDSRATTGMPDASASATSGAMARRSGVIMGLRVPADRPVHPRPTPPPRPLYAPCMAARTRPSRRILRPPEPRTLRDQVVLEEHDVAADGSFAVVSRRTVDGERYVSDLWLVPLDGGEPRRLTNGASRDKRPRVSPHGDRIAFTRKVEGSDDPVLMLLDLAGGEPAVLALGELSPGELAWSPDSRTLAFTAETGPERFLVGPKPKAGEQPRARHVTTIDYRWDEEDYLDRRPQLFVVAAHEGARARQLTTIAGGVAGIAWRPDSRAIAFVADPRPDADRTPRTSIWEVAAARGAGAVGREPREILALRGPVSRPVYSRDCVLIAGVGVDDPDFFDDLSPTLYVGRADESAPAVALAPDLDRPVGQWADTDLTGWMVDSRPGPAWDGEAIVALVTDRGRTHPGASASTRRPAGRRASRSGSRPGTSWPSRSRWARDASPSSRRSARGPRSCASWTATARCAR